MKPVILRIQLIKAPLQNLYLPDKAAHFPQTQGWNTFVSNTNQTVPSGFAAGAAEVQQTCDLLVITALPAGECFCIKLLGVRATLKSGIIEPVMLNLGGLTGNVTEESPLIGQISNA